VTDHPGGHGESVRLCSGIEVGEKRTAAGAGPLVRRVDSDLPHPAQIDHQAAVDAALP